jgi:hypothetical protein
VCGTPRDARPFDSSRVVDLENLNPPFERGREEVLARYVLHPMHCGVLSYFAQFTDRYAKDPAEIATPGYEWQIRSDGQPLDPYLTFDHIINPWGLGAFAVEIRLEHGATIEFAIRNTGVPEGKDLKVVAGRIVGRHWYDTRFGGAPRRL